jgi:hypothetical protein
MTDFTMKLTDEQIVDALRIHCDECPHPSCGVEAEISRLENMRPAQLKKAMKKIVRSPWVVVLLARRYYPAEIAQMERTMTARGEI